MAGSPKETEESIDKDSPRFWGSPSDNDSEPQQKKKGGAIKARGKKPKARSDKKARK